MNNKNTLFICIWTSDWDKFIKIYNLFNNISICLPVFHDSHLENKNLELFNQFYFSTSLNYAFKRSFIINDIYNYLLSHTIQINNIKYISFIFEDSFNFNINYNNNNIDNLLTNIYQFEKYNYDIYILNNYNLFIYKYDFFILFKNYINYYDNIQSFFFVEKLFNIYDISYKIINNNNIDYIKKEKIDDYKIFKDLYKKINHFDFNKKQTWIIQYDNYNDFNIELIYLLLYLPFNYLNFFIILNKKIKNKNIICDKLKDLLSYYHNLFLFIDFPHLNIDDLIKDLKLFTNYNNFIYYINSKLYNNINNINNINFNIFLDLENNSDLKKINNPFNELDYFRLLFINNINLNTIFYNKKIISSDKIFDLKKKIIQNKFIENQLFLLTDSYKNLLNNTLEFELKNIKLNFNFNIEVIHLEKRFDRLSNLIDSFQSINLKYNIDYHIFNGIQFNNINELLNLNIIDIEKFIKSRKNKNYIFGSSGCKMSHLSILQKYKDSNLDFIFIFEDDFTFSKDILYPFYFINESLNELKINNIDWDLLYLHSTNNQFELNNFKYLNKLKNNFGFTTSAYIIPIKKINNIINLLNIYKEEIDVVYTKYLNERYVLKLNLGYQIESFSDILDKNINYNYL